MGTLVRAHLHHSKMHQELACSFCSTPQTVTLAWRRVKPVLDQKALLRSFHLAGVGFCTADVNMDRLPGWEPQSYGYHGDDGNAFRSDGKGRQYGPTFGTGKFASMFYVTSSS